MGDAGSMLIGFTVIWVLLQGTQGPKAQMNPVTALWLIAIPLMDMTCIMVRRIRKGFLPLSRIGSICIISACGQGFHPIKPWW